MDLTDERDEILNRYTAHARLVDNAFSARYPALKRLAQSYAPETHDILQRKAHLQDNLKAAKVYRDDHV
jgi:hypothetical protein